jgi:hypothetical protein
MTHKRTVNHQILQISLKIGADLYNPESVKEIVAQQRWKESQKMQNSKYVI